MADNKEALPDIVDRLRGGVFGLNRIPLCEEAATVISELRAEVERLTNLIQEQAFGGLASSSQWIELTGELRAEVERHKADADLALGALADIATSDDMNIDVVRGKAWRVYNIIRAARSSSPVGAAHGSAEGGV